MDLGLGERAAIVTGASSGIGAACTEQLLAEGASVCAIARDPSPLRLLTEAHRGRVVTASCDLSTEAGCRAAVRACIQAFGRIDILVNCAGAAPSAPILDVTADHIRQSLQLKLQGYLTLSQLVAPHMIQRHWGRIVMVAGSAGTSPTMDNFPISLANIGVHNMVRALNDALAAGGVQTNVVSPGLTRTPRAEQLLSRRAAHEGRTVPDLIDDIAATIPARRIAEPSEVARAVCFLASEAAAYIHGSVLYMDGGSRRGTP